MSNFTLLIYMTEPTGLLLHFPAVVSIKKYALSQKRLVEDVLVANYPTRHTGSIMSANKLSTRDVAFQ